MKIEIFFCFSKNWKIEFILLIFNTYIIVFKFVIYSEKMKVLINEINNLNSVVI